MQLLDLPSELLRLIVQDCYDPWTIQLRKSKVAHDIAWRLEIGGVPSDNVLRVNRTLHDLAKKAEIQSFTGTLHVKEESPSWA